MSDSSSIPIIYEGPPRWDGRKWLSGDRFVLSGPKKGNLGVELAKGASGLERPTRNYRYSSDSSGILSKFTGGYSDRRKVVVPINILGDSQQDLIDNKNRWFRNHPEENLGKLWFRAPGAIPRYMPARISQEAALGDMERDPTIRKVYQDFEWGWESDVDNFLGEEISLDFTKKSGVDEYTVEVYNPSTVGKVYPKLYLYGEGQYSFSLGYMQGEFQTVLAGKNNIMRIDFNPAKKTYQNMDANGKVTNLWPYAQGKRPKFFLEPETSQTITVKRIAGGGTPDKPPKLAFVPEFLSWT